MHASKQVRPEWFIHSQLCTVPVHRASAPCLHRAVQDASPGTPIFVFLSPGVDVAGSVEALGRRLGFTQENGKYFSVSLGQGQVSGLSLLLVELRNCWWLGHWVLLPGGRLTCDSLHACRCQRRGPS